MKSKNIVESVAEGIVRGINMQKSRKKNKVKIMTLCNFGELGLLTPLQLSEAFYNSFEEALSATKSNPTDDKIRKEKEK